MAETSCRSCVCEMTWEQTSRAVDILATTAAPARLRHGDIHAACLRLAQGLDAFNAVSRAAVGVATSLDTHIEQLMGQHGWADGGGGRVPDHAGRGAGHGARRAGCRLGGAGQRRC